MKKPWELLVRIKFPRLIWVNNYWCKLLISLELRGIEPRTS